MRTHDQIVKKLMQRPGVRAEVAHRAVIGDRAVDHEFVWMDGPDAAPTELVVIYSARAGRIARVDFVRKAVAQ